MSFRIDRVLGMLLLIAITLILGGIGVFIAVGGGTDSWVALGSLGQYIEATIVTLTAVAVYRQYRRWREESSAHAFEGFKFTREVFESEDFRRNAGVLKTGRPVLVKDTQGNKIIQMTLSSSVTFILSQLDMVESFTQKGFIDREVLFEYGARGINEIGTDLDNHAANESSGGGEWITEAIAGWPRAEDLLGQVRKYWSDKGID